MIKIIFLLGFIPPGEASSPNTMLAWQPTATHQGSAHSSNRPRKTTSTFKSSGVCTVSGMSVTIPDNQETDILDTVNM